MVHSLSQPPLFTALSGAKKILLAGAGGAVVLVRALLG